jgi:hypothetical protein
LQRFSPGCVRVPAIACEIVATAAVFTHEPEIRVCGRLAIGNPSRHRDEQWADERYDHILEREWNWI